MSCSFLVKTDTFAMVELGGELGGSNSAVFEFVVSAIVVVEEGAVDWRGFTGTQA